MKKHFFDLFQKQKGEVEQPTCKNNLHVQTSGRSADPFSTDFLRGISFEENPLEDEIPDEVRYYDFHGNEVERP